MFIRLLKCNTRSDKSNEILNTLFMMWLHGVNGSGKV